jgi:hypothetical protein
VQVALLTDGLCQKRHAECLKFLLLLLFSLFPPDARSPITSGGVTRVEWILTTSWELGAEMMLVEGRWDQEQIGSKGRGLQCRKFGESSELRLCSRLCLRQLPERREKTTCLFGKTSARTQRSQGKISRCLEETASNQTGLYVHSEQGRESSSSRPSLTSMETSMVGDTSRLSGGDWAENLAALCSRVGNRVLED